MNTDEGEVQEIFQRTMRSRLESFKSAKMGVSPPKPITKQTKKDQQQQVRAAGFILTSSSHGTLYSRQQSCVLNHNILFFQFLLAVRY